MILTILEEDVAVARVEGVAKGRRDEGHAIDRDPDEAVVHDRRWRRRNRRREGEEEL